MIRTIDQIDAVEVDLAVRKVIGDRPVDHEQHVVTALSQSEELAEFVEILSHIYQSKLLRNYATPAVAMRATIYSAVSVGLEVGYALGIAAKGKQ